MDKFIIEGGVSLKGAITLGGAKNAGYKLMIASLLTQGENAFLNVTDIGDVEVVADMIKYLGGNVDKYGERAYCINAQGVKEYKLPEYFGEKSRASLLFAGPLLSRFKKAVLPYPGGDRIGTSRDIDRHLEGLENFDVSIKYDKNSLHIETKGLKGCRYRFRKPSHTATENLIMVAVCAEGKTLLENCGLEPEIDDLINYLNKSGAKIKRLHNRVIEITGVKRLTGCVHKVIPDRNQAITYAIAAIMTKGSVLIEDARAEDLKSFLDKLDEANGGYEIDDYGIRFFYKGPIKATDVITQAHPAFMTDWQPLWAIFMTQARGMSSIIETIYDNRFQYVDVLNQAGANITYFDPKPKNPTEYYSFNPIKDKVYDKQGIHIEGTKVLKPINVAVWDVRFGATLLLASLITKGTSELRDIYHIDRGYDQIDKKMILLGAKIKRCTEGDV